MKQALSRARGSFALIGAAVLFGILIPDFRYDALSIAAVIFGRPLLAGSLALWAFAKAGRAAFYFEVADKQRPIGHRVENETMERRFQ